MELIILGLVGWLLLSAFLAPTIGRFCNPLKVFRDRKAQETSSVLQTR